eukprot:scaffold28952_cov58-Attheya_sp.AAC.4
MTRRMSELRPRRQHDTLVFFTYESLPSTSSPVSGPPKFNKSTPTLDGLVVDVAVNGGSTVVERVTSNAAVVAACCNADALGLLTSYKYVLLQWIADERPAGGGNALTLVSWGG